MSCRSRVGAFVAAPVVAESSDVVDPSTLVVVPLLDPV